MITSKKLIIILFGYLFTTLVSAEQTAYKNLGKIKISGSDGYYYFMPDDGGWGAAGCTNATLAYVNPALIADKEAILATVLAAKMANTSVAFDGSCDDATYFLISSAWLD